jgi:hypothetical protein
MNENPILTESESITLEQEILTEILTNQQEILKNQRLLLKAERNRRIWGIVKMVFFIILIIVPLFFIPTIMRLMMGEMMPEFIGGANNGLNLNAILGNSNAIEALLSGQ